MNINMQYINTYVLYMCVCYLVESYMCLVHQINIELADKSPKLLWVSEWLSLLHRVTYNPHNCMLDTRNTHV